MRRLLAVVLAYCFALPAKASDVQIQGQGQGSVPPGLAGAGVSLTPTLGQGQGLGPNLTPTLLPAIQTPLTPVAASQAPSPVKSLDSVRIAEPKASLALPVSAVKEQSPSAGKEEQTPEKGSESSIQAAGALFDGTERRKPSFMESIRSFLGLADKVPLSPQPGATLRVKGRSYTLGRRISEDASSTVYDSEFSRDHTFRFLKPGVSLGQELSGSGIPHADLLAKSEDGRVWVQRRLEGETPAELDSRSAWRRSHLTGFADLAAALIAQGRTADLSPGNLLWERWGSRWALLGGKGYSPGSAGSVLSQILAYPSVDPVRLLSGLRGRLGPDSAAWARVLREPALKPALASLPGLDGPRLRFSASPKAGPLDDSLASRRDAARRLGYDPFSIRPRRMLHSDDPGKLNTQVFSVRTPDGRELVGKIASAEIIRNELFLRKVVHRWFGEYFDAPWSLAWLGGSDSSMLMRMAEGSRAYAKVPLSLPQRVALGVLMRGFGVSDVNPGNVLYSGGKVALIDFEQALGRARPVHNRIPDPGILLELPWANGDGLRIEDFLPGVRDWRELLAKPETQAELSRMLLESGFAASEVPALLETLRGNAADLHWTLQSDIDFAESLGR